MSRVRQAEYQTAGGPAHELIDDTLYVEDYQIAGGRMGKGIIGRCSCGWDTGHRFSSGLASVAFRAHLEEHGIETD